MFYEDYEEGREEWRKDLNSWKKRRKSASSVKQKFLFDNNSVTSSRQTEMQDDLKTKSLKNRKWNKFQDDDEQQKPSSLSSSPPAWRRKVIQDDATALKSSAVRATITSPTIDDDDDLDRAYHKKIIRINQMPKNPRGFGFELEGGREEKTHVFVAMVMRGSSADICGLKTGDKILLLNGIDIRNNFKESINGAIDDAVIKGAIELKIGRFRDSSDDLTTDDDFEVNVGRPTTTRWSGSQSSYRSTPPLPPQPDHTNEGSAESPPPLPLAPPPPVNWTTFPEGRSGKSGSSDTSPTQNGDFRFGRMKFYPNKNEKEMEEDSVFHGHHFRKIPSPIGYEGSSSSSQASIKHPADQIRECLAIEKMKYPDNSEELKSSKDKKKLASDRHNEISFPVTSDSDEGYNSHKYVAEFSATELDNFSNLKTFKDKRSNSMEGSILDRNVTENFDNDSVTASFVTCCVDGEKTNETNEKTSDRKLNSIGGSDSTFKNNFDNKVEKSLGGRTNIEEAFKIATDEWKRRDRKVMEFEENKRRNVRNRLDDFSKEDVLSNFDIAKASKPANRLDIQESFINSVSNGSKSLAQASPKDSSPQSSRKLPLENLKNLKLEKPENFVLKKSEYKPVNFRVNKFPSHHSGLSKLSKSYDISRDKIQKSPDKYEVSDKNMIPARDYRSYTRPNDISSINIERAKSEEDLILKQSIKEEELELKKLRNQQEVEKIKLERLREEKKVEELKIQRIREEEEVHKIKERRLKEESEIKKLEKQKNKTNEDHEVKSHSSQVPINENNTIPDGKTNFSKTFSVKSKTHGDAGEKKEENPYIKTTRTIFKDAGLSSDKIAVKSIQLNKPNFFSSKDKSKKVSHVASETSRNQTKDSSTKLSETRTLSNSEKLPCKSPSYFGPTFKRLAKNQNNAGNTQSDHVRSRSSSEIYVPDQGSNINFLLYGDDHSKEQLPRNVEDMGRGREIVGTNQNGKSSAKYSPGKIRDPKEQKKNNITTAVPPWFRNIKTSSSNAADNYVEEDPSDRSGFLYQNKIRFSLGKLQPTYRHDNQDHERQALHYNPDDIFLSSYSGFTQKPRHSRSASIDNHQDKSPSPIKDSAADRLFPGKKNLSNKQKNVTFVPSSSNVTINNFKNPESTSPNAVDTLFAYNNFHNYDQKIPRPTFFDKKFSSSTTNLSYGYDPSTKSPNEWTPPDADHLSKSNYEQQIPSKSNNFNRSPRQFSRPNDH